MFLRHRFMWLIIAVSIVLVVGACGATLESGVTEVLTAEQITAVGCDAAASEGQIKRCFATVIRCNPQDTDLKMNVCMENRINAFNCGTIGETPTNDLATCVVGKIQAGNIPE